MKNTTKHKVCPLCQQDNKCMVKSDLPCWCMKIVIPAEISIKIPEDKKGSTCICLNCLTKQIKEVR